MRLIYVTSSLPHGPGESFIVPEIKELLRQGHEVVVVPMWPRGPLVHEDATRLVRHGVIRPLLSAEIVARALMAFARTPLRVLRIFITILRSRNLLILMKNLAVLPKGLWLAWLARWWHANHIHCHWAATTATMAMIAAEASGLPWSFTAHRWDISENNLLARKVRSACFCRAISERGAQELEKKAGVDGWRPRVIHMGVPLPPSEGRHKSAPDPEVHLLMAANFVPVKGHIYLLLALKILRDRGLSVYTELAGDGPLRDKLSQEVKKLGLEDRVRFLGIVPHGKLMAMMQEGRWSVVVLPSVETPSGEREGIPVTLIEAMSFGIPVISTNTGGIPELLRGGAGILVAPEDPVALADAIELLVRDPENRERVGKAGRKRVQEEFAVEAVVKRLVDSFQECRGSTS